MNGAAKRLVQTFTKAIKKGKQDGFSSQYTLCNLFLSYHSTSNSTTGRTPCELLLKQPIQMVLDLLKLNIERNDLKKQATQNENHDPTSRSRCFCGDQPVMVCSYRNNDPK